MSLNQALIAELKQEAQSTRKLLERVPNEHFDWKPHQKSMSLGRLASHVADLPLWTVITTDQDELNFAGGFTPFAANSKEELLSKHDDGVEKAVEALSKISDEQLMKTWRARNGEHVVFEQPKVVVLRSMVNNHLYHHRGQLTVYLRLLDVPIPGMYGPSADEA